MAEAHHITDTGRFLAPMDQTHTMTAGLTYRHPRTGMWAGLISEYGSGTPLEAHDGGHGHDGDHDHGPDDSPSGRAERVPAHFTINLSLGVDLWRDTREKPKVGLQFNVENLTDNVYKIAQESIFSPAQFYIPRLYSGSVRIYF